MQKQLNLLRIDSVKSRTGLGCNSTVYHYAEDNLITKPVKIGPRASAWPEHEIDTIVAARIAGKCDDEIREIVKELTGKRKLLLADVLAV